MNGRKRLRDFSTGVLVGVLIGSVGVSAAAFGYKGWQRFDPNFRVGWITGFLDMAQIARAQYPDTYVDRFYPSLPQARPAEYVTAIDKLYEDPQYKNYGMTRMVSLAIKELEKKYGPAETANERMLKQLATTLEVLRKKKEAAGIKTPTKALPTKPPTPSTLEDDGPEFIKKVNKKWCRCDGKTPAEAHVARRAKEAAEEKAEAAKEGEHEKSASPAETQPAQAPDKAK